MVANAAKRMRVENQTFETLFRGQNSEITLKREEYMEEKRHGWLAIGKNI